MIFDALLAGLMIMMKAILGIFPMFTSPNFNAALDDFDTFGGYLAGAGRFIDVGFIVTVVTFMAAIFLAYGVTQAFIFLYRHLPGKAS
jgi:hypothetical protein